MAEEPKDEDTKQGPKDAVDTAVKGALTWPDAPAGDPNVSKAFLIGWRVGLAHDEKADGFDLGPEAFKDVLRAQVNAAASELVTQTTVAAPVLDGLATEAFDNKMVAALSIQDPVLGRACRLGLDLQSFCAATSVDTNKLGKLRKGLSVLATKFPPYAAHSVMNSLTLIEGVPNPGARLKRQGDVWRPLLAGETAPKDLLHMSDYVGTAAAAIRQLDDVARQAFRGMLIWIPLLAVALFGVGIWLMVSHDDKTGFDLAGVSTVLAAFGLTWKGIGTSLGRAAAKAERSLWDSQLNWTIAYRATIGEEATVKSGRQRRLDGHTEEWKRWQAKAPDLELDAID